MQNVATINSSQITPIVGPVGVPVVEPVEVPVVEPVATCAATGDVAKSNAVINPSFFIYVLVLSPTTRCVLAAIEPEHIHTAFAYEKTLRALKLLNRAGQ